MEPVSNLEEKYEIKLKEAATIAEKVESSLSKSEHRAIIIRFVEIETAALSEALMMAIGKSKNTIGAMRQAIPALPADLRGELMFAIDSIRSGDLIGAASTVANINNPALNEEFGALCQQWEIATKMLRSYFTPREIEMMAEKIPFVHDQVFSYNEDATSKYELRALQEDIRRAVFTVAEQVKAEDIINSMLTGKQLAFALTVEDRLFPDVELADDNYDPFVGFKNK